MQVGDIKEQNYLTLILGAGASMPYNFPSGPNLVKNIISEASIYTPENVGKAYGQFESTNPSLVEDYEHLKMFFNNNGYTNLQPDKIAKVSEIIAKQLSLYTPTSIDSYLGNLYSTEDHEAKLHADLCKYFIGKSLIDRYHLSSYSVPATDEKPKWLPHLFNAIFYYLHKRDYNVEDLPIKIITFNYDTLLEQHFFDWVKSSSFLPSSKQRAVIKLFCESIRHVYGQLGFLADNNIVISGPADCGMDEFLPLSEKFTSEHRRRLVRNMALNSIKRIGLVNYGVGTDAAMNRANQEHITDAQTWLRNTNTLVISGYAFDDENNQQLNLQACSINIPQIYCTTYNAGFSLIESITQTFRNYVHRTEDLGTRERDKWIDGEYKRGSQMFNNGLRLYNSTTLNMLSKEINLVKLTASL